METLYQQQVDLMGSEEVYRRVDQKLANLEIDPFFYHYQLKLIHFRERHFKLTKLHLRTKLDSSYDFDLLSFLSTQKFSQIVKADKSIHLKMKTSVAREASAKFAAPIYILNALNGLHYVYYNRPCECHQCNACLRYVSKLLLNYPEAMDLVKQAFQSSPRSFQTPATLQEQGMVRVLELGLPVDCLPQTLRQRMKEGPEWKEIRPCFQRLVEELAKAGRLVKKKLVRRKEIEVSLDVRQATAHTWSSSSALQSLYKNKYFIRRRHYMEDTQI